VVDDGHSSFARHWADHRSAGERMPAAVVLGGDPAGAIAANLDLPAAVDGYLACGLLRAKALDLVKCRTHALEVPAEADLVLEGYLDPQIEPVSVQVAAAGGSHYRVPRPAPVFHVAAVTHRSRPIFPALVSASGAGESRVLARARERLLLPALRRIAPDIVDLHLPALGGLDRYAFVALRKRYDFQARQVAAALWGSDALRFTKFLVLVDHDVNVHDVERVLENVGANVAPDRDLFSFDGPAHGSDHAGSLGPLARHLAIDATAKLPGEQQGAWPARLDPGDEVHQLVTARWAEYRLELSAECGQIAAVRAV
jgi:4-hydroxy-3-polyprenylbenzoate decarboxylase